MNVQEVFKGTDGIHYGKIKKGRRVKPSSLELLVARASIYEVAQKLGLKITKKNKSILCFVHRERTPSCNIVDGKGMFFCKGCGHKGNVMHLVMQTKGKNQIEAAKWLQKNLGYVKLEFEDMIEYVELEAGGMNDYLEYVELEAGESHESIIFNQDIENYKEYMKLQQDLILAANEFEVTDPDEINSIENFYQNHPFDTRR